MLRIQDFVASCPSSPLAAWAALAPSELTSSCAKVVRGLLSALSSTEYSRSGEVAVHRSAVVEAGATIKGPLIIGAECFVASGSYVRGGCWLAEGCTVGPGVELKSTFVFSQTTFAHFNFVGDSIVGANVNLEAGAIVCNFRNERPAVERAAKFGALIGDGSRIGANAVLAPGTILPSHTVVARLALVDHELRPSAGV